MITAKIIKIYEFLCKITNKAAKIMILVSIIKRNN